MIPRSVASSNESTNQEDKTTKAEIITDNLMSLDYSSSPKTRLISPTQSRLDHVCSVFLATVYLWVILAIILKGRVGIQSAVW